MKILLWAPYGSGIDYWGPGISAFNLYGRQRSSDFEVHLAHGYKNQKRYDVFKSQHQIGDIGTSVTSNYNFLSMSKKWIKSHGREFDVVHALSAFHYSFMPAYWFTKIGVPSYIKITAENSGFNGASIFSRLSGIQRKRRRLSHNISGFIAISKAIEAELLKVGIAREKIHLIPNGVDTDRFKPLNDFGEIRRKRKLLGVEDRFTLLFVGGVSERKNPSLAVEAIGRLRDEPIQLLIVGPNREVKNEEESKIRALIKEYDLRGKVYRFPFTKDIESFYEVSDAFILPSRNEGMSNALLEALSCGLPCLVTPVSGSTDLVKENVNGYFIELTVQSLVDNIIRMMTSRRKIMEMRQNARQGILNCFDSNLIFDSHISLFKSTL